MNLPAAAIDHRKEAAFSAAWCEAVRLSERPNLFYGDPGRCRHKQSLSPKVQEIRRCIGNLPRGQACWLALLVQFYNPEEGAKLAARIGANAIGAQTLLLSGQQRDVLTDLITHYRGW